MPLEVEQKFPVADFQTVLAALERLGAQLEDAELQVDEYFAHPTRDFAATDEALRIRQIGPQSFITYKGPKLDAVTKTRRELELAVEDGALAREILQVLDFRPVAAVRKRRRHAHLRWRDWDAQILLDDVEQVGIFVEVELMAEPAELDEARQALLALAAELGLSGSERRSYLELLLSRSGRK